jgi:hypothetical protein
VWYLGHIFIAFMEASLSLRIFMVNSSIFPMVSLGNMVLAPWFHMLILFAHGIVPTHGFPHMV